MSCMLRVGGKKFDVDKFLALSKLKPTDVFRKGEPRSKAKPNGKKNEISSINISVSKADFTQVNKQIADAIKFLQKNKTEIRGLTQSLGVDNSELDFGIVKRNVAVQTDCLPPDLISLAGNLGLGISMTLYPNIDKEA